MGKKQSVQIVPNEAQQWTDFLDKDFKSDILNIFRELKDTIFEEWKASIGTVSHQVENISKEISIIKKKKNRNSEAEARGLRQILSTGSGSTGA